MKKTNYLLFILMLIVASLASCKKDDETKPQPKGTVTAKAGNAQNVTVGQTVTLDGSASTDSDGKTLTYSWATTKKPNGSNITLTNPTQAKPTFVPDVAGEYEFELTASSDNGQSKAKVVVTATGSVTAMVISQDITADRVLANIIADPTKPDYIVTADIEVSAKLTINPGVVIQFDACKGMYIDSNPMGAIIAKGTTAEPISFTGKEKVKGYWKGIMVYSSSTLNEMDFVDVSYAGCSPLAGIGIKSNLVVYGNATPGGVLKITNSSFTNSGGYGLYIEDGNAVLAGFANNTVSNNTGIAMYIEIDQVHMLDAASKFNNSNAGFNGVEIDGATVENTPEVTWNAFADGSKYFVSNDIEIRSGVKIAPGATFEFASGKAMYIDNNPMGYIIAKGTSAQKITFTGRQATNGFWKGIMVYSSSPLNEMDFVDVSYAGNAPLTGVSVKSNLVVYGNATPGGVLKITNSNFTNSGGYGLYIEDGNAVLAGFANNTVSNNTGIAMYVEADQVHMLDAASKFNNNNAGFNGVEIDGETLVNAPEVTWNAFADGSKYFVSRDIEIKSGVKIAPGVVFHFAADKALYIDDNGGYIIAKGTAAQRIIFTGSQANKGFWKGIMIYSASSLNEMDYVDIAYAGSNPLVGVSTKCSLVVYDNATPAGALKINHSDISNSGGYGIMARADEGVVINPDFETSISFAANTAGNIFK